MYAAGEERTRLPAVVVDAVARRSVRVRGAPAHLAHFESVVLDLSE